MRSWMERIVSYEGDLDAAAQTLISELDEVDGVVVGSKEFRVLIKTVAREFKVGPRDLARRVQEFLP
jgi:hypothetical protein